LTSRAQGFILTSFFKAVTTLPDNFSDRSAETDSKRPAKPFYSKTVLQTVLSAETICKIVLLKIRKAQNMTVIRIYYIIKFKKIM